MRKITKGLLIIIIILIFNGDVIASGESYEVHFLDTGQSDCILIKGKNNNYLIDTGASYYTDKILKYLDQHNVDRINKIIITHYHDDHYGGLFKIMQQKKVDKVMLPMHENKLKYQFYKEILRNKVQVEYINKNWQLNCGKIFLKVVAPIKEDKNNENNNSIVIYGQVDGVKYLFSADCEREEENQMVIGSEVSECDLIKIPHHCLNTSSTKEFLRLINPQIAIGTCNGIETPDYEVIKRIKSNNIKVYRTDEVGDIFIKNRKIQFSNSKQKVMIR